MEEKSKNPKVRSGSQKKPESLGSKYEMPTQLTYLLKDSSLIRTFVFSQSIMIFIGFLFYFIYYLFYDYLTIVIFAVISSIALRKTKDKMVLKIFNLIYSLEMTNYQNSLAYRIVVWVIENIIHFKQNRKNLFDSVLNSAKSFNFTNDIYVISVIFVGYLLFFNVPLRVTFALVMLIILMEFTFRLCIDLFYFIKHKLRCHLKKGEPTSFVYRMIFSDQEKTRGMIDHLVTILMIIVFFFTLIGILLLFLALCAKDIKLFLFRSQNLIDLALKKINDTLGLEYDSFKINIILTKNLEEIFNVFLNKQEVSNSLEFLKGIETKKILKIYVFVGYYDEIFKSFNLTNSSESQVIAYDNFKALNLKEFTNMAFG